MKGDILCEVILGEEFSLLFSILFLLVNKILSFLFQFNSWFLNWFDLPDLRGEPALEMEEAQIWAKKVELLAFMGTY